ncbi:hypothetical protein MBLNU230_g0888t1 [Neophaeotheca triangularis]
MSDSEIKATPKAVAIKPTAVWTPLPLEDDVPPPYNTPRLRYEVTPLHPTFACELRGVDWNKPISPEEYEEIRRVTDKYGVVVCRTTGLDDESHIQFSSNFGELDDVKPYVEAGRPNRFEHPEIFDASNIDPVTGKVAPLSAAQVIGNKANELFHVDSSFNGRRAGHSLLLAHVIPPAGTGGATEFADSRTAYDDLPRSVKERIEGVVANHSLFHSRKKAVPEFFKEIDPWKLPLSRHRLVQYHEGSSRKNLYIASYVHHLEGMESEESTALIEELMQHLSKPKYRVTIAWQQNTDMIIWDNTCVAHRATGGTYEGKHPRDMRRTTVKDMMADILKRTRQQLTASGNGKVEGGATLDARVERLEHAMQAVVERLDGESNDRIASVEVDGRPTKSYQNYQGDTAFQAPIETFNASLAPVKQQLGLPPTNSTKTSPKSATHGQQTAEPSPGMAEHRDTTSNEAEIRIGAKILPFPQVHQYHWYLNFFFDDINLCHPCVNETDFRSRSERMAMSSSLDRRDSCFLALHYIIFAVADILVDVSTPDDKPRSPGWKWYLAADELVGKQKISGRGDLSLVQFLIFEAFYLTHADHPDAAYNISGLMCRLCFQFGLHQQSLWIENCDSYAFHMKQRIFWVAYFTDRRISLSVGRPHCMRDSDIEVDLPAYICDKELVQDEPLPPPSPDRSFIPYLSCMVAFARFGGEIWDSMFSAGLARVAPSAETIAFLDAKLLHWSSTVLPSVPILPTHLRPEVRHYRQDNLVRCRISHLRLLLRRRLMVTLQHGSQNGRLCGELAIDIVQRVLQHHRDARQPSSFRFHMAVSLGGALMILATLLCRPLTELGLQDCQAAFADHFRSGYALLQEVSSTLQAARRTVDELKDITSVVMTLINQPTAAPHQMPISYPPNMDKLFAYGPLDFVPQSGYPYETYQVANGRDGDAYIYDGWNTFDVATGGDLQNPGQAVAWL